MQHSELRGGVLLLALLHSPLRYIPPAAARLLTGINRDRLQQDFVQWTQESAESVVPDADGKVAGTLTDAADTLLARYAKNMTADARNGRLDPVLCRDHEIDLMIDILCRRRKNNPVVVGEAGVGKSALIEGLALRIVAGQVPDKLKNTDIMTLDLGALQAGASVKGEFEKRFKGLMAEVISSPVPVILFIDEAHTLIGAGNQQGGLDISNLLKPALARGELKTIAATTWSEYKKYFEKDAALSRRFQLVKVSEPNAAEATIILRGLSAVYEQSHGVLIDDDALQAAATLSERYLSGRQLPDKAIDVLDTACARVAINLSSPPKQISALTTLSHQQEAEIRQLERELRIGLRTNLLIIGQGTIQTVHGDNPVTGNGKQIRAGIADGNTGLTTVHHWHHSGGQRTVCGHHAAGKKQAAEYYCRIIFSHRLFPPCINAECAYPAYSSTKL